MFAFNMVWLLCLVYVSLGSFKVACMFSKMKLDLDGVAPTKRFRHNVADLYLSNDVSGTRAWRLYDDAKTAGCKNVSDLAKNGGTGSNHCSRNLLRKLKKHSHHLSGKSSGL